MSNVNDPTGRVLELLSLLQTHRFWTGAELAGRLDVSERTLRRDVERLRTLGYEVDATPGAAGGYRLAAGNHLPPLLLDDEEAVAIAVGLRAAADAPVEGIDHTSLRALAKLEQVLPDRLRRRVRALHGNVTPMRWSHRGPLVDPEALALLSQACRDHEQVQFDYSRRDGEQSRRLVEPHQLVSAGRRWYLVAFDLRREDWRTWDSSASASGSTSGPRRDHRSGVTAVCSARTWRRRRSGSTCSSFARARNEVWSIPSTGASAAARRPTAMATASSSSSSSGGKWLPAASR